jgi:ketose-bisphosphate aldolase
MACVNMSAILPRARREGWAVGAFNILDYASMKAVVQTAESLRAPVVVQTSVKTVQVWGCEALVGWYRELGERAHVPVVLHLDHCKDLGVVRQCVEGGWTSVMIDASSLPYDENLHLTREVVAMARPSGISVEAELGHIGGVEEDITAEAHLVDVEEAVAFCRDTGVDLFAPAIGTAHGFYKGAPKIAFDRLDVVARRTGLPLALHGGTGLSDEVFRRCIALGCAKVNISTMLKHTWVDSLLAWRAAHPDDYEPVKYLAHQLEKLSADVAPLVRLFGGEGKAA